MIRHVLMNEFHAVLRTMVVSAGTATGATWVVDDDGGADFTSIQAAADAVGVGDITFVRGDECPRM